uniref:Homing endonuclease LAGLIDADG domain-containing protein n=1 Tax=[Candida] psychrophila TaxID=45577 RepID=A0A291F807_9ASCO|nr:hypothetical protein [[Candida] psychrophila]ATG28291.1 hypothetical protein [[Candida] psychrophila]
MFKKDLLGCSPNRKMLKEYKAQFTKLTKTQKDVAMGLILGDAYTYTRNNSKSHAMKFEWGYKSKEYIDHVYSMYEDWMLKPPYLMTRINKNNNEVKTWRMETLTGIPFNILGELFIMNKKKHMKINTIKDHTTAMGLAHWDMDDGNRCYYKGPMFNKDMSVVINTQGFEMEEVKILMKELNEKFNLNSYLSFNKKKPMIYIPNKDYDKFYNIMNPFMPHFWWGIPTTRVGTMDSMRYKLPFKK